MEKKKVELGKIVGPDEAVSTILFNFIFPEDIEQLKSVTDLTAKEVFFISFVYGIIDKLGEENIKTISNYFNNFLRLRISMWREGRKEALESTIGLREAREAEKRAASQLIRGLR